MESDQKTEEFNNWTCLQWKTPCKTPSVVQELFPINSLGNVDFAKEQTAPVTYEHVGQHLEACLKLPVTYLFCTNFSLAASRM